MGKRIIPRARGKGGPRYRAPSHKYTTGLALVWVVYYRSATYQKARKYLG